MDRSGRDFVGEALFATWQAHAPDALYIPQLNMSCTALWTCLWRWRWPMQSLTCSARQDAQQTEPKDSLAKQRTFWRNDTLSRGRARQGQGLLRQGRACCRTCRRSKRRVLENGETPPAARVAASTAAARTSTVTLPRVGRGVCGCELAAAVGLLHGSRCDRACSCRCSA